MPRNIVLLLDGTANALTANTTNLPRLYKVLEKSDTQQVFYDPGVGTFEEGNSFLSWYRRFKEVLGMATGWGLDRNVKQAYRYLCQVTGDTDEITDEIYLMGFSRGSHTARVLAGLIHQIGLLRPDQMNLVDYAYDAYKRISNSRSDEAGASVPFEAVDAFTSHLKPRRVPVRCVAVFDTVSSMIEIDGMRLRLRPYANTTNNPCIKSLRHAVAIDERRIMFKPRLWGDTQEYWGNLPIRPKTPAKQDVQEVWFSGVHADIGGGYPEDEAGLAKVTLKWVLDELAPMGLKINKRAFNKYVLGTHKDRYIEPDPLADPHDSMNFGWKIIEFIPFKHNKFSRTPRETFLGWYLPLCKPRHIKAGSNIHTSVFKRRGTEQDYLQPNIPDEYTEI
ncbi:MAG: DUF2235 domain-containing protein [Roseovarius sp.]|nr:DUF2235 domain-containing protein [Roseovarius sp.]